MNRRKVFIIVPSLEQTGPIKGAVVLSNALSEHLDVHLVALKPCRRAVGDVIGAVQIVKLYKQGGWLRRLQFFRNFVAMSVKSQDPKPVCLSMCFSADLFNFLSRPKARRISSIRGHLPENYRTSYGMFGAGVAHLQYLAISKFDTVIAMTQAMANQFQHITGKRAVVIGNFIDELAVEPFRQMFPCRNRKLRFIFVGRLSKLKKPDLVLQATRLLLDAGFECTLEVFGDGEEAEKSAAASVPIRIRRMGNFSRSFR